MTRLLAELLGARQPAFHLSLNKLELTHGLPSHDVRLTSEVLQAGKNKLKELGLDPADTTARELYHALQERLKADDKRLEKALRTRAATYMSADGDVVAGIVHGLQHLPLNRSCYALKPSVLKALLTRQPPKKTMKQLGYRSLASLLKHESALHILAAAWLVESDAWRRTFVEHYRSLTPRDFEVRQVAISTPRGRNWSKLAAGLVSRHRHNLVSFNELGAIVILPLPADRPTGSTTAVVALAVHALNEIRAASTYLQLMQVRSDFGQAVQQISGSEAYLNSAVLGQPVPWQLVHRFYARLQQFFEEALFEPYIHLEDLGWHAVEEVLQALEPHFAFWHNTAHLGLSHGGQPVTFNVLDNALNVCNSVPFESRLMHYGRNALQHEVLLRYLKPEAIEAAVKNVVEPQLAEEVAVV